jgi:YebC/PmpR family DNA-binding regulatory protein
VAARQGLPDPTANFQLRTAIDKAKAAGIPNENIERAIAKGSGHFGAGESNLESIRYEGYGPGGVAILVEALTDNRNRTAADLRVAFSKNGGNLGETGCVSWMFSQKGVVTVKGSFDEETLLEASLEGGAESYEWLSLDDDETNGRSRKGRTLQPVRSAEVFTEVTNLETLSKTLQAQGFDLEAAELRWFPGNSIAITDLEQARSLVKLMDALEDLDDVQTVVANFDMTEELMVSLA